MCGNCKIDFCMVLLTGVDGEILLLPVCVRYVENVPIYGYLHCGEYIQSYYICPRYVHVS